MSQANLDLMRAVDDAYDAGDLDRWLEHFSRDVEVFPDASAFPESGPVRGRKAFKAWTTAARSALQDERWERIEVRAIGDDRVLTRYEWSGEGVASGARSSATVTTINTFRDGRIVRVEFYLDHDRALEAAGLEE